MGVRMGEGLGWMGPGLGGGGTWVAVALRGKYGENQQEQEDNWRI